MRGCKKLGLIFGAWLNILAFSCFLVGFWIGRSCVKSFVHFSSYLVSFGDNRGVINGFIINFLFYCSRLLDDCSSRWPGAVKMCWKRAACDGNVAGHFSH